MREKKLPSTRNQFLSFFFCASLAIGSIGCMDSHALDLVKLMPSDAKKLFEDTTGSGHKELTFSVNRAYPQLGIPEGKIDKELGRGWEKCYAEDNESWVSFLDRSGEERRYIFQHLTYYRRSEMLLLVAYRYSDASMQTIQNRDPKPSHAEQHVTLKLIQMPARDMKEFADSSKLKCVRKKPPSSK